MENTSRKEDFSIFDNPIFYTFNSFLLYNLIPIAIIFIFTPYISRGYPFSIKYEINNYFFYFGLEVLILVLGISLGIILSGILMKIMYRNSRLNQIWSNSYLYHLLFLFPAAIFFFVGKSGYSLVYKYDDEISFYIISFIILTIFYSLLMMIMRESRNFENLKNSNNIVSYWANSIRLAYKKMPSIIVLFFFLSICLELRFNTRRFLHTILSLQYIGDIGLGIPSNYLIISFATSFLVLAIHILILNIILFIASSLIKIKESPILILEENPMEISMNKLSKILFFVLSSIFIIIFTVGKIYSKSSAHKILFLWSPYYSNTSETNLKPIIDHWFGTDILGRDVFSLILFSISEMFVVIIVILFILFILSFIFRKFIHTSTSDNSDSLYDVLANFPSLPILIVIAGYVLASSFRGNVLLIFLIYVIFFWPRYIKRVEYTRDTGIYINSLLQNFWTIIPKIVIDIVLLGFLGLLPSNSFNLGIMLRPFMSGPMNIYWWNWLFPLLFLYLIISTLRK